MFSCRIFKSRLRSMSQLFNKYVSCSMHPKMFTNQIDNIHKSKPVNHGEQDLKDNTKHMWLYFRIYKEVAMSSFSS